MKKRVLSVLMVLAMVLSMVPVFASAATQTPEITQVSMTLSGILDVNFKVASNGADMSKASVAIAGSAAQTIETYTRDGDLYVYTAKVPAHKLPETMTVSLVYDGTAVQTESWTANADYLSKLTGDAEALASALNSYGTYAAAYAAGNAGTAIDGVTAEQLAAYKPTITVNSKTLGAVASLYLDDAADLLVKFNESAWGEGYQLTIDGENAQVTSDGNGKLVYTKEGLLPQDWSRMYEIKVVNGDETVYQVSYSVYSYIRAALKNAKEVAPGLNNLLKSMYAYGSAAQAYAPASKTAIALANLNLRDPFVLNDGDAYYLYGTGGSGKINVWSSTDLATWYVEGACLTLAEGDEYYDTTNSEIAFWAPEVYAYNGAYYMFATFTQAGTGNKQATAILKADSPVGPFEKWSDGYVTPAGHSALDGTLYIENGTPYMIYCHEHECTCLEGTGTVDYIQLSADLKSAVGESVQLFEGDRFSWGSIFNRKYSSTTDGVHVYTKDGVNYLQWSTHIDGTYNTVYTTFETLADGVSGTHNKLYNNDGGHSMIFTDMNGVDKLILHTPNSSTSYPAIFNVTASDGTLALENVNFINFIGVDGTANSNASSYSDGATTALVAPTGRTNATFVGWFDADGNQVTSLAGKDGNLTLTAKWQTADIAALSGAEGIYELTDNVTCSATVDSFAGTLNGNGKKISASVPVFAQLASGVTIEALTIDVTANIASTGILCSATSQLTNVTLTDIAIISSNGSTLTASGINCGAFTANIAGGTVLTRCSNAVDINRSETVDGDMHMGGLVGLVQRNGEVTATFVDCSNSGNLTVTATNRWYVGGIAGGSDMATYTNCVNTGDINTKWCSAGIVSQTDADTYIGCTNSGTLTGLQAGGIAGRLEGSDDDLISITNCKSEGNIVASTVNAGSLFGAPTDHDYTVCLKGNTFGENTTVSVNGTVYSAANLLYHIDMDTSKFTAENEQTNGDLTVTITSLSQLEGQSGTFYLGGNITGNTYTVQSFSGTLIGNGYTVSTSVPLFASLGSGAQIKNLTIDVTTDITSTGILCSSTSAVTDLTLTDIAIISSNGSVLNGTGDCGAFMAKIGRGSVITGCSNAVDVNRTATDADIKMGGLFAYTENGPTITNCSNSGDITGSTNWRGYVGGIVGDSYGTVYTNCSNSGTIGNDFCSAGIVCIARGDTFNGCTNTGTITGESVSGIAGRLDGGDIVISNCASLGNAVGTVNSGSLVAQDANVSTVCLKGNTFGDNTITVGGNVYSAANLLYPTNLNTAKLTSDNEQVNTFVITYNPDGGSMSEPTTVTVVQGTTVNLTAEPTKAGYSFLGWYNGSTLVTSLENVATNYTLTAHWQELKAQYTFTYNLDGGTNAASNLSSYEDGTVVTLADATQDGYMFLGWYDDNGNKVTTVTADKDITVTAKWALYIYDLLDLEDSDGVFALAEDIEGFGVSGFSGTLYGNGYTISTSEPLFASLGSGAKIENLVIDLTADLEGTGILCSYTSALTNVTLTDISIISSNGSTLTASDTKCGAFTAHIAGGTVLTRCSNAVDINRSETVDGNMYMGGLVGKVERTGEVTASFVDCSNSGNLTVTATNRWFVGGIAGSSDRATYTNCVNTGDINTKWCSAGIVSEVKADTYIGCTNSGTLTGLQVGGIAGRLDGGDRLISITNCKSEGNMVASTVNAGSLFGAPTSNAYTVCLKGNTFGENTTVSVDGTVYSAANLLYNIEMDTSKFTAENEQVNTFVITYNPDGGSMSGSTTVTVNQGTDVTLPTPTKSGYNFLGWFNGSTQVTSLENVKTNYTLTAKWQLIKDTYTVTYNLDGGTNASGNLSSYEDGTVVTLSDATKSGSAFAGWFDAYGNYVKTITVDRDITLTARWGTGISSLSALDGQSGTYVLTGDITNSATVASFSGTLYGNGHTVSTSVPLFASIGSGAVIQNLDIDLTAELSGIGILCSGSDSVNGVTLTDIAIKSTNNSKLTSTSLCGSFMHRIGSGTTLTNCSNSVDITFALPNQDWRVIGGLVAYAGSGSAFTGCSNSGDISGTCSGRVYVGGIAGESAGVTYTNCTNSGNITSPWAAAGIAAVNKGDTLIGCINSGTITAAGAGGLLGRLESGNIQVINCQSLGNVIGTTSNNCGSLIAMHTGNFQTILMKGNTFGSNTVSNNGTVYSAANLLYPIGKFADSQFADGNEQTNNV